MSVTDIICDRCNNVVSQWKSDTVRLPPRKMKVKDYTMLVDGEEFQVFKIITGSSKRVVCHDCIDYSDKVIRTRERVPDIKLSNRWIPENEN